jgi:hypothetical protein
VNKCGYEWQFVSFTGNNLESSTAEEIKTLKAKEI